jgi:hypothetical protein
MELSSAAGLLRVQQGSTATSADEGRRRCTFRDGDLRERTPADVLRGDGMQEVWGSNPHSSTVQRLNSNGSNTAYSSKVQQRRPASSRTSVLVQSGRGTGRRPELRAA